MKRLLWLFPLAVITLTGFITMGNTTANNTPAPDKSVAQLWKDYESARRADRPQRAMEVLQEIKRIAIKERLPWDFYRAGDTYVDVASSRNWKLRDSLYTQFQKDIEAFDEPILTFFNSRHNLAGKSEFLKKNRDRLEKGRHTEFYEEDDRLANEIYEDVLVERIPNDWEYALWSLILGNRWNSGAVEEYAGMLEKTLGDRYPDAAFLEFTRIQWLRDEFRSKERLEEYARKYNGKAVSLMARQALLAKEFEQLERDEKGTSEQYKALRDKASAFEKDRKAFSGKEKDIAECFTQIESLIEQLDDKGVWFTVEEGLLTASLRNLSSVTVTVKDKDRTVFSSRLDNPARSYYRQDTVKIQLPAFDDGSYSIECKDGKVSSEQEYKRYGLSAAHKEDARGYAIYVARAKSGEPVRKADITLLDNKDKVLAELKDFDMQEGFTYLPKDFTGKFLSDRWKNRIVISLRDADGTLRKTQECSLASIGETKRIADEQAYASIFVDRSAFNPGETVRFKVVRYYGDMAEKIHTQANKKLTVKLFDVQGKIVGTRELETGEFGSAAGEFLLERQERGGIFRIAVFDGNRQLASASIRVDDFILPTFDLAFDPDPNLYFPGDSIEVKGTIKSYSGHSLTAADIRYAVTERDDKVVSEGVLHPDRDGRFTISFLSGQEEYLYYNVHVSVSDATGETLEWNTGRQVQRMIPFSARLENRTDADVSMKERHVWRENESYDLGVVSEDIIKLSLHTETYRQGVNQNRKSLRIDYTLKSGDKVIASGKAAPGDILEFDTSGSPSGLYVFEAVATDKDVFGNDVRSTVVYDILKVKEGDSDLHADVLSFFNTSDKDGAVTVQIGATDGPVWAVVDLYGTGNIVLGSKMVHLTGLKGKAGSLETVRFNWPEGASDVVRVNVVYFKDYRQFSFSRQFDRSAKRLELPLAFTRFLDKTAPGTAYSFEIATKPGVECVATIFDKSSERIMANRWSRILMRGPAGPSVSIRSTTGMDRTDYRIMTRGTRAGGVMFKTASNASADMIAAAPMPEAIEMEEALGETVVMGYAAQAAKDDAMMDADMGADIAVREDFAKTVAFEPFLRSDSEGRIRLDFTNADKLSTYFVQLFAHNKDMDNAVLRQEMVVTVPAKVSLVEPQYLYAGDHYFVKASLSSSVDETLAGRLRIDLYDGKDYRNTAPIRSIVKPVTLEPHGALSEDLEIEVPDISELGIKLTFIADGEGNGSDAVFVSVPVYKAVQTLTESHSSILHSGESMEELLAKLKGEFVNVSAEDAILKDISLLQMVKEALPTKAEPASENALDLSEALYVRLMAAKLGSQLEKVKSDSELLAALMACRDEDGGFAWFKGMDSSPIITAVLLDRYAGLRRRGIDASAVPYGTVEAAVKYLDKVFFGDNKRPIWCGGLSEEQYVSVRVMYPEVEFSTKDVDSKKLRDFRKRMKEYLTPRKERGLNGYVFGKARRLHTLVSLAGSEEGRRLAAAWGVRLGTGAKLRNSAIKDLISLQEYAIAHPSGGWYYPNAVMPYRGLLESEAYAHAFIADLLRDRERYFDRRTDEAEAFSIADGISLWLMVQKETQHWDEDASFVNAIATILDASQETLDTRIISLSKTFTKPFEEVKAAGNGFTVERRFFVERTVDGKVQRNELSDGDKLSIGDKVFAEYRIWNEENRSFVKLTAPRPASLRPANQLSGQYGWWLGPLSVAGWHTFTPHGYRSVLADRTEYWFDTYPEENTVITEEFLVTQSGSFQMPAVSIESLYAPHYRANDRGRGPLLSN